MTGGTIRISAQPNIVNEAVQGMVRVAALAGFLAALYQPAWTADLVPPPPPDAAEAPDTSRAVIPLPAPPSIKPEMRTQPEAIPRPNTGVPPGQRAPGTAFDQKLGQKNAPPPTAPPARPIPDPPHAPAVSP